MAESQTRLQQRYIGNHEEKLTAREHGFDRDFWAGSPSDCTTKLYRVHVKPRSSMFDPRQCATSLIPVGVEILSRKTYLRETRGRRVAQLEHNFNDDKDVWSGTVEGTKWTGVSVFHLSVAVTPHVMRTVEAPATGRVLATATEWNLCGETETPQAHWNWDERQRQETTLKHESWTWSSNQTGQGSNDLDLESQEHAVTNVTVASRMIASRFTPTPLFDLSRCQRGGPLF